VISRDENILSSFNSQLDFAIRVKEWRDSKPFSHLVIPNFLPLDLANRVAEEFPTHESSNWKAYKNPLEEKKLLNDWEKFGPYTYQLIQYLCSSDFVGKIEVLTGGKLWPDFGLNGGGLHTHRSGSKLNVHLDYSIHPKLGLERRLNLLIYLTPTWNPNWGGALELWEPNENNDGPGRRAKSIDAIFNTAVIFDTSQNSWHGLPEPINCPKSIYRNSLATYYLCEPRANVEPRGRALYAPYGEQANDPGIRELIRKRSDVNQSRSTYGD